MCIVTDAVCTNEVLSSMDTLNKMNLFIVINTKQKVTFIVLLLILKYEKIDQTQGQLIME